MTTRSAAVRLVLALGAAFVVACGAGDSSDPDPSAGSPSRSAGAQGPGTPIPGAAGTPSAPAQPAPAPAPDPGSGEPAPTKKVLTVAWQGQETYYWCGPGSTRMALSTRMKSPPSQTTLANELPTTTDGTDHIGLVANVLNKYFDGAAYAPRSMADPPSQAERDQLKKDLVARISAGFPIVANVVSGWRPPTYPSGTIYHYVAVVGFDDGGEKVLIADPAAEGHGGGARWNAVPRTYWISLHDLGTWIGGKGYAG